MSSSTSKPAQTLIDLSSAMFIKCATALRQSAQLEVSRGRDKFNAEKKEASLLAGRDIFELTRKMYAFSLINAKSGLKDAANAVSTNEGILSKKEMKRLEASQKARRNSGSKPPYIVVKRERKSKSRPICYLCQKVLQIRFKFHD